MTAISGRLGRVLSIDWSKRVANLLAFFCAIVAYIAWPFLPLPGLHWVVYNVDLAGALPTICACLVAAALMLRREGGKAPGHLLTYLIYALLVATVLIFSSVALDIRLILVPGGVNLDIVLLLVSLVAFFGVAGRRGFWGLFLELFFLVGIPLLLVDFYLGFAISVMAHIPYQSLVVGGGGLADGLNKMFFMLLVFALAYSLLMARWGERMEALGARYFGAPEGGAASGGGPAAGAPAEAP